MFKKILIANRGEIACRIMRTARELGVHTVAVYSDADRNALHVEQADDAVYIGAAAAQESYLQAGRIIDAALTTGAQAIHPGYGFLSENASFARACQEAGLVFIGPPASAIDAMGSKSAAKRIMQDAGVPLIPGYHGDDQSPEILRGAAQEMGYPVLLKASAGGGGKGMRQVWSGAEFDQALAAARREAMASFGDDHMLVEKYLTKPRHVEIQVFFDNQGNGVYLAERDCSVQRRHQKIIEEAPAPGLSPALRKAMGESAVTAAAAIDYCGAGTVEFLLDEDDTFYFMEMNTRLQVEHPVTEMVTGQDLVAWQLQVASGQALPLQQDQITVRGHAFEARIYAEDPLNDFLPATGPLDYLYTPSPSPHVRIDSGVRQGDEVSVYYDPMIAKLVTWDSNRERALARLASALSDFHIAGTATNIAFLYQVATHNAFIQAQLDTGFVALHREALLAPHAPALEFSLPAAALALLLLKHQAQQRCADASESPWNDTGTWRMNLPRKSQIDVALDGIQYSVEIEQSAQGYRLTGANLDITAGASLRGDLLCLDIDGVRHKLRLGIAATGCALYGSMGSISFHEIAPDTGVSDQTDTEGQLTAPMNGTIVTLLVAPGEPVEADQPLLIMEAMKMEHTIRAPAAGIVTAHFFAPGDLVDGGAQLVAFEPAQD
jgi:3-methylcrotonyl-CoA carboxylase alpha subunit